MVRVAKRWRDTDHLARAVESAGGREAFDAAVGEMLDRVRYSDTENVGGCEGQDVGVAGQRFVRPSP